MRSGGVSSSSRGACDEGSPYASCRRSLASLGMTESPLGRDDFSVEVTMDVLRYNELNISAVKKQYDTVVALLQQNNFAASGVKQFAGTPFYLVPLDSTQGLLFRVVSH